MGGDCASPPILARHAPAAFPAGPDRHRTAGAPRTGPRHGRAAVPDLARQQGRVTVLRRALRAFPPLLEPRLLPLPPLRLARAPPRAVVVPARPDAAARAALAHRPRGGDRPPPAQSGRRRVRLGRSRLPARDAALRHPGHPVPPGDLRRRAVRPRPHGGARRPPGAARDTPRAAPRRVGGGHGGGGARPRADVRGPLDHRPRGAPRRVPGADQCARLRRRPRRPPARGRLRGAGGALPARAGRRRDPPLRPAPGRRDLPVPPLTFAAAMRNPRVFANPLAVGAPDPLLEIPVKPARMIHFFDPSNEKIVGKLPALAAKADVLLGNLEDAIPVDSKEAARAGLVRVGKEMDLGDAALWTRVNALESPWVLDDLTTLIGEIGDRLDVVMIPKVEGAWDIHYVDRLLAQLEARVGLERPILVHAILETSLGVVNLEEIATASPRMQGMSFGPADLAASRRMKTTRVGGGHPGYRTIEDPDPDNPEAPRPSSMQDPWHYSIARMVDACTMAGILPFYGPYGDIRDVEGCETQFRAAFLLGCVGAWSLHPVQIDIAKKVFSPDPDEVRFAKKVIEAIPDGRGVHMIDGKMQDDATWKQCRVMVDLAEMLAHKDPELAEAYGFAPTPV